MAEKSRQPVGLLEEQFLFSLQNCQRSYRWESKIGGFAVVGLPALARKDRKEGTQWTFAEQLEASLVERMLPHSSDSFSPLASITSPSSAEALNF